jgi:hypothetical protein
MSAICRLNCGEQKDNYKPYKLYTLYTELYYVLWWDVSGKRSSTTLLRHPQNGSVYKNRSRGSSVSIATGYELAGRGIEYRWGRDFLHSSSLLYNGYRVSFLGVKRPERDVDHPTPSRSEVKERLELYLYTPSGLSWPVLGWNLF